MAEKTAIAWGQITHALLTERKDITDAQERENFDFTVATFLPGHWHFTYQTVANR